MKKRILFSLLALGALFFSSSNVNVNATDSLTTENLTAVADTHVRAGTSADLNYGRYAQIGVRARLTKDANYYESYIKFSVPSGVVKLSSAELELTYNTVPTNAVGRSYTIYTTDTGWNEGSGNVDGVENLEVENKLTYNTTATLAASHEDNYTTFEITGDLPAKGDVLSIEVTNIVNEYLKTNADKENATQVSFRIVSNSTKAETDLTFRTKENTNVGAPNLLVSYDPNGQDEAIDLETEIAKLDTTAQLNFDYSYTGGTQSSSDSFEIDEATSEYVKVDEDFSNLVGLDLNLFKITAQSNGATNTPRVHSQYVRMYANNSIVIEATNPSLTIGSIEFTLSTSSLNVYDSNNNQVELDNGIYVINGSKVTLKNESGTALNITALSINYNISTIEYTSFSNVCMKFKATIPTVYFENITSYGIKLVVNNVEKDITIDKCSEEDNNKSFAVVLQNIKDYNAEISATAYVVINGTTINLMTKTHSVKSIVAEYILRANELGLSSEQVYALNGFDAVLNA